MLRSDSCIAVPASQNDLNDAEPAPAVSQPGGVDSLPGCSIDVDAAENLRSKFSIVPRTLYLNPNDVESAPAVPKPGGVHSLPGNGIDVDAAENLHSGAEIRQHKSKTLISLSLQSAAVIRQALEIDLLRDEVKVSQLHVSWGFRRSRSRDDDPYSIDAIGSSSLSEIIRSQNLSVEEAVKFVRGETEADSRPNKALDVERLRQVLFGYEHLETLVSIAEHGIEAQWSTGPTPRRPPPKNHGSCRRHIKAVTRSIREGQDSGQYMVVDADILSHWNNVVCSPLGAVEKKDADPSIEVRTIHDLSFPKGESTNSAYKQESAPKLTYEPVTRIAHRIEYLASRGDAVHIKILKGDVKGAYRHLRTIAAQVHRMAAFIKELRILIIDLAAPFGWSGSPPFYGLFGRAILWLVSSNSPASVSDSDDDDPFFGYEWVDDHILVEPDVGDRLILAEATLRHAMLAVLGPRSINETKFSEWSSELVALGLVWNTTNRTVSMPQEKIAKALKRVEAMLARGTATKTDLQKLLGSLRHIATCVRTAKPFYQNLHTLSVTASRFARVKLSANAKDDLLWFRQILAHGHLSALPLCMFGDMPRPDVELYMDASNMGLAVLDPAVNKYIQLKFDEAEELLINLGENANSAFSINTREHLCIALALWTWGSTWNRASRGRLIHVKCWSDNTSAVNWCNRLYSQNQFSKEINRAIGMAEAYFNLRVSAEHLPGSTNWMADAGSRAWSDSFKAKWANFSLSWQQTPVPPVFRKIYMNFSSLFNPDHWPRHQPSNTQVRGSNGIDGAATCTSQSGYQQNKSSIHTSSHYSQRIAGGTGGIDPSPATLPQPCSPRSATSRGIIGDFAATVSDSRLGTSSQLLECAVMTHPQTQKPQLHSTYSKYSIARSISPQPSTESSGGLRCWASSFFYAGPSI